MITIKISYFSFIHSNAIMVTKKKHKWYLSSLHTLLILPFHMPHSFSWYTREHIIHFTTYFIYLCHFRFMIKTNGCSICWSRSIKINRSLSHLVSTLISITLQLELQQPRLKSPLTVPNSKTIYTFFFLFSSFLSFQFFV